MTKSNKNRQLAKAKTNLSPIIACAMPRRPSSVVRRLLFSIVHRPSSIVHQFLLILSLCIPGFPASPDSTATLIGTVYDAEANAPIPFATLTLQTQPASGLPQITVTDLHGRFTFADQIPGAYLLEARQVGFEKRQQTLHLQRGLIAEARLKLPPKPIQLSAEIDYVQHPIEQIIKNLLNKPRLDYLCAYDNTLQTFTFDAFGSQEVKPRASDQTIARLEYVLKAYIQIPDHFVQEIEGLRGQGKWPLSMSPGLTEKPAQGTFGQSHFKLESHPLSPDALDHYHFELINTVQVGSLLVARIGLSPRHGRKPGVLGEIWVSLSDDALVGYDLRLNRPALQYLPQIERWQVYQQNALFFKQYWLPIRQTWHIETQTHQGHVEITCYNHTINGDVPQRFLKSNDVQIHPQANHRDSLFWQVHTAQIDTSRSLLKQNLLNGNLPAAWTGLTSNRK